MIQDQKLNRRNSFTQMGAMGALSAMQAPSNIARRQSFQSKGPTGLSALKENSPIFNKDNVLGPLEDSRKRAVSFEQSDLVFQEQKKFYKPRQRMPQPKAQTRQSKGTRDITHPFHELGEDEEDFFMPQRGRIASEKILILEEQEEEEGEQSDDSTYLSNDLASESENEGENSDQYHSVASWCSQASPMPTPMPAPMPKPEQSTDEKPPQMWLELKSKNSANGKYLAKTMPLLPAIVEENNFYKQHVGTCIFPFVESLVDKASQMAPKITGMLIDLQIAEVRNFMQDYQVLTMRVQQATEVLNQVKSFSVHNSDLLEPVILESKA